MKHLAFWSLSSVLLVLLFAACGESAPTSSNNTTASSNSTPTSNSSTTMSGPNTVQITEKEMTITSSLSTFTAGVSYHFMVKNAGNVTHEFMIMPKDEGSMGNMPMDHMDGIALAKTGDINAGDTTMIDYTFPASAKGTHPQFVCYVGGHYDQGMKLDVSVS